jgi:hypothetical protein
MIDNFDPNGCAMTAKEMLTYSKFARDMIFREEKASQSPQRGINVTVNYDPEKVRESHDDFERWLAEFGCGSVAKEALVILLVKKKRGPTSPPLERHLPIVPPYTCAAALKVEVPTS